MIVIKSEGFNPNIKAKYVGVYIGKLWRKYKETLKYDNP